ncbi:GGDEF domain-containing protein [Marinobacter sp.]|uniref:GGDEF domain-containing protein n=1 Tax=Marinobacter sp. TaxID=50741 RepID=UPI001A0FA482|nr:GGDEF domain-containing protein [Marinobacter sp.]MBE0486858.1 GGDEF domain-containing protein [Marinobacter sp.]
MDYLDQPFNVLIGLLGVVLLAGMAVFIAKLKSDIKKLEQASSSRLKRLGNRVTQLSDKCGELSDCFERMPKRAALIDHANSAVRAISKELADHETRIIKSILNEGDLLKGLAKAFELLQPDPGSALWTAYCVSVLDQHRNILKLAWHQGLNEQLAQDLNEIKLVHGTVPHATAAMLAEDVQVQAQANHTSTKKGQLSGLPAGVQTWHSFPVKKIDGDVLGTFDILRFHEAVPLPDDDQIANYLFVVSIIVERHSYLSGLLSQARTDRLTGINNRGYAEECLTKEIERSQRYNNPLSVILFDIDHFKTFNDTYGHDVGDLVLQEVARVAASALRATDVIGRWGGEEFLIILSETDLESALVVAENVRKAVAAVQFEFSHSVTISAGASGFVGKDTAHSLVKSADEALYQAKAAGRNCTLAQRRPA